MPKLTDETWQVIRDQWAAGASDAALATQFGVSRQTIERRATTHKWRNDACEGTSGRPPDRPQAKGSDSRGNDGGAPSQPIRDRAQLALKHQAEWEELESIRADVVAAFQDIRIQLRSSVSSASPDRQNRKSSTGTQNLPPGLGPRVTLDEHLKQATRWAALYEKAASGLQKAQEGERRAYGFDYKMQQQQTAVDPVEQQRINEMIDYLLDRMDWARQIEREHKERQKANAPEAHDD